MSKEIMNFTEGKIFAPLLRFALPILGAQLLQSTYGAVDLLVVGRFCAASEVSAVSTGGQVLLSFTGIVTSLAMGATVLLGRRIGEGRQEELGGVVGNTIRMMTVVGVLLTAIATLLPLQLAQWMNAPAEALQSTRDYLFICGIGMVFIVGYNLLGCIFRGIGDSKTPLLAVSIACVLNIAGDILFVGPLGMGAKGAALATTISQGVSVVLCLLVIKKRGLPFAFNRKSLRRDGMTIRLLLRIGIPLMLQDFLVGLSFLVLLIIVNSLGVIASAGMGVAEKLCGFIMLIPSSFSGAISTFVAQNIGAGQEKRARRGLLCGILSCLSLGVVIAWFSFFHGDILCGVFSRDTEVVAAGADYLRAYSIDVILTSFLFCFIGYFNGCGRTGFTALENIVGAFGVRIPVSYLMSRRPSPSLFSIGLATPCSSFVQILFCAVYFLFLVGRKQKAECNQIT